MREFEPERLIARLKAAESVIGRRWIEVNEDSGEVIMHHTAEQIIAELERNELARGRGNEGLRILTVEAPA